MRIKYNNTSKGKCYYIIRSVYKNGKNTSEIVEKLGYEEDIIAEHHCSDAHKWMNEHLEKLNQAEAQSKNLTVLVPFNVDHLIDHNDKNSFNIGYLFLQKIYYGLGLPGLCKKISKNHSFSYDLDSILSRLVYGRILFPSSKLSCYEQASGLYEQPKFELHQVYRALSVIAKESDLIQETLYKNSLKLVKRKTGVLYYDCTNYFFEIEKPEGLKQYGVSKEHRPNPIVQMGLFMDRSGMPLAFNINDGNTSEQLTLRPLEEQIMRDFELSKFVICTDAGLSSRSNRLFNNFGNRSFITTQSIKKLDKELREWCLDTKGWRIKGSSQLYDISEIEETPEAQNLLFFKERYVEGYDEQRDISFNQTLIVTYSLKYKAYHRAQRAIQIEKALKRLERDSSRADSHSPNDYRRLIKKTSATKDGEIAEKHIFEINQEKISSEEIYDGFYAVFTNLDDDASEIAAINRERWKIEESFRIMKTDFESRPVYVQRDDRIKAHFMTCFISLLIYRILEEKLDHKYTVDEIIKTLRNMSITKVKDVGYIPSYTRTQLTDSLHEYAGFRTDFELMRTKKMQGICKKSKE